MDAETRADISELLEIARRGGLFQRAAQNAIPEAALRAVVERAGGVGIAAEDLMNWLESWIHDARREREARSQPTDEGEAFEAVRHEAQRRFDLGQIDDASQAFMEALEREEQDERKRQEERRRAQLQLLQEAITYDKLAFRGEAAAAKLRRMAEIECRDDRDAQGRYLFDRASEYYEQGQTRGDNAALLITIAVYRAALEEMTREQVPLDWATTQMNLGTALASLGQRESGTARLEEAVTAHRAALEERTRERVPLDWAMSTGNQGVALMLLAERLGDVTKARSAVQQIEVAFATTRDGGNAPAAAYYEAELPKARSLLDLLTSRSQ